MSNYPHLKRFVVVLSVFIIFAFLLSYLTPEHSFATDTGALSPGTMSDDATVGTDGWGNPDGALTSNDVDAAVTLTMGEKAHYLKATGFGFAIPSTATITGIVVEFEHARALSAVNHTTRMRLVRAGTIESVEKNPSLLWPMTDTYDTYGTSSDLWGASWTYSDINNADFGVVISLDAGATSSAYYVDHIRITVYYTDTSTTQTPPKQVIIF